MSRNGATPPRVAPFFASTISRMRYWHSDESHMTTDAQLVDLVSLDEIVERHRADGTLVIASFIDEMILPTLHDDVAPGGRGNFAMFDSGPAIVDQGDGTMGVGIRSPRRLP